MSCKEGVPKGDDNEEVTQIERWGHREKKKEENRQGLTTGKASGMRKFVFS